MDKNKYIPDGENISAALDHMGKLADDLKARLKEQRAERDKNKNEELSIPPPEIDSNLERIIKKGSLYQKAIIYLQDLDVTRTFKVHTLTREQAQRIREELYSPENWAEGATYTKIYNAFIQYGKLLEIMRLSYQTEATRLTGLINQWEAIQAAYSPFTELLNSTNIDTLSKEMKDLIMTYTTKGYIITDEDGRVVINDRKIKGEIEEQAKKTRYALSKVKAFIEPLSDYIYSEGEPPLWPLLPHELEMWMDYPDAIEEQKDPTKAKYFRYILRKRREEGEEIPPEEEAIAVYPDYNEIEANHTTLQFAQQQLSDIFFLWEVQKREKTKSKKRGRPRKSN